MMISMLAGTIYAMASEVQEIGITLLLTYNIDDYVRGRDSRLLLKAIVVLRFFWA